MMKTGIEKIFNHCVRLPHYKLCSHKPPRDVVFYLIRPLITVVQPLKIVLLTTQPLHQEVYCNKRKTPSKSMELKKTRLLLCCYLLDGYSIAQGAPNLGG